MHQLISMLIEINHSYAKVAKSSANTRNKVENEEALAAPEVLQGHPKHPQSEHIAEDVAEVAQVVEEEVRHQLVGLKMLGLGKVQAKHAQ